MKTKLILSAVLAMGLVALASPPEAQAFGHRRNNVNVNVRVGGVAPVVSSSAFFFQGTTGLGDRVFFPNNRFFTSDVVFTPAFGPFLGGSFYSERTITTVPVGGVSTEVQFRNGRRATFLNFD